MLKFEWDKDSIRILPNHPEEIEFYPKDKYLHIFWDYNYGEGTDPVITDWLVNIILEKLRESGEIRFKYRDNSGELVKEIARSCRFESFEYDYDIEGGCSPHEYFIADIFIDCYDFEKNEISKIVDSLQVYDYEDAITIEYCNNIHPLLCLLNNKGSNFYDSLATKWYELDKDPYLNKNDVWIGDLQYNFVNMDKI